MNRPTYSQWQALKKIGELTERCALNPPAEELAHCIQEVRNLAATLPANLTAEPQPRLLPAVGADRGSSPDGQVYEQVGRLCASIHSLSASAEAQRQEVAQLSGQRAGQQTTKAPPVALDGTPWTERDEEAYELCSLRSGGIDPKSEGARRMAQRPVSLAVTSAPPAKPPGAGSKQAAETDPDDLVSLAADMGLPVRTMQAAS